MTGLLARDRYKGFAGALLTLEYRVDRRTDRGRNIVLGSNLEDDRSRAHALCDLGHLGENLIELATTPEARTHEVVAAVRARTGRDQVADAGEPGECLSLDPPMA